MDSYLCVDLCGRTMDEKWNLWKIREWIETRILK